MCEKVRGLVSVCLESDEEQKVIQSIFITSLLCARHCPGTDNRKEEDPGSVQWSAYCRSI